MRKLRLASFWIITSLFFIFHTQTHALQGQKITIASYNIENLWDNQVEEVPEKGQPKKTVYGDYSNHKSNWLSQEMYSKKAKQILKSLEIAEYPDIVALQELESSQDMHAIWNIPVDSNHTFGDALAFLGYTTQILGPQSGNIPVSVTTGFISKFHLTEKPSIKIEIKGNERSSRDIQVVELSLDGNRVLLYNGHFKSRRGKNSNAIRTEFSKAIRSHFEKASSIEPEIDAILMGDFNAFVFETTLSALGQTNSKEDMVHKESNKFYNLWYELPLEKRWETSYNGGFQHLSHMLLSKGFFHNKGLVYIQNSFHVIGQEAGNENQLLNVEQTPYRWQVFKQFKFAEHIGQGFSDHLPLVASFEWTTENDDQGTPISLTEPIIGEEQDHEVVGFPQPKECNASNSIDISHMELSQITSHIGKCAYVNVSDDLQPVSLCMRGRYRSNFIHMPLIKSNHPMKTRQRASEEWTLGISMLSAYNWRPNHLDPRVSQEEIWMEEGKYHPRKPHPKSNQCFQRKVLQGYGGKLKYARGILGYSQGNLQIHIANRLPSNLQLTDLPKKKKESCLWSSTKRTQSFEDQDLAILID